MATPPSWLKEFTNQVIEQILPTDPLSPIGCHFHQTADEWEVTIFVSRTEILGGQYDGESHHCRFHLNLQELTSLFDHVETFAWQALPMTKDDDLGAHVALEGTAHGERVWLRITAVQPEMFESGRVANVVDMTFESHW